jgi:hypothetical protein
MKNLSLKFESHELESFKELAEIEKPIIVHVRLGDMKERADNIEVYYERLLSSVKYITGYISSDSIEDPICKRLIHKYNLIVIYKPEIETIMFASTCNTIVLSGGTFSWLIGFFAFFSNKIYYPCIQNPWYGNIFTCLHWIPVSPLEI